MNPPQKNDDRIARIGLWVVAALGLMIAIRFGAATQDDAFISFRYAENLVAGHGLVYNPGEWVEGISNLSWTLLIAGAMALGLDPVAFTILAGLISIAAVIFLLGRGANIMGARGWAALVPAAFIIADPMFLLEAVEGLESAFYAAVLLAGTLRALNEAERGANHLGSSLWFALAIWTRPEAPLLIGAVHLGLLLQHPDRPAQLRRLVLSTAPIVLACVLLEWFRITTYGEWLPNTYYAKTGAGAAAIPRGLDYLLRHLLDHGLLWVLVLIHVLFGPRQRATTVLAVPILLHTLYVVWVGGDFKATGRFFVPVVPFMALLAGAGLAHLATECRRLTRAGSILLAIGWMVAMIPSLMSRAKAQAAERHANLQARKLVGEWLAAHFPPDTVMAIHSAGVIPYYAGLPTIDMWGLSDKHIARTTPPNMGRGMAGHEKTDPGYVFAKRPTLFLPEDRVFVLRPWDLEPNPTFPASFSEDYRVQNVSIEGRWFNFWVRMDR